MSVEKWWNANCGRKKPTQTPFRPPHGMTRTRNPSEVGRSSIRQRHEAAYILQCQRKKTKLFTYRVVYILPKINGVGTRVKLKTLYSSPREIKIAFISQLIARNCQSCSNPCIPVFIETNAQCLRHILYNYLYNLISRFLTSLNIFFNFFVF